MTVDEILERMICQRAKANWCHECKEWVQEPMMICHPGPSVEGEPLVKSSKIFFKNDPRLIAALKKAIEQRDGYIETACALGGCETEDFGRFKQRNEAELAAILKGDG